jgi:ABC-type glycerol-3-phosphate transport system substrate-binding protein
VRKALLLLLLLLAAAGCGGGEEASSKQPEPTAGVQELENVLALRADFAADAGKTRVILLFSPT